MTDFGSVDERAAALRVALAAKELNSAVCDAARLGVTVDITVLTIDEFGRRTGYPFVQVGMERRTMILPTKLEGA
jgi:hypothetical protein